MIALAWVKKWWWVLAGGFLALVALLLVAAGRWRAAEALRAGVNAGVARAQLQHLAVKTDAADAALARIQAQRDAAEATHADAAARLGRELQRMKGLSDAEVEKELARRGHR